MCHQMVRKIYGFFFQFILIGIPSTQAVCMKKTTHVNHCDIISIGMNIPGVI